MAVSVTIDPGLAERALARLADFLRQEMDESRAPGSGREREDSLLAALDALEAHAWS
jgi:hypothetical protein